MYIHKLVHTNYFGQEFYIATTTEKIERSQLPSDDKVIEFFEIDFETLDELDWVSLNFSPEECNIDNLIKKKKRKKWDVQ